jgi:hypothetical protein
MHAFRLLEPRHTAFVEVDRPHLAPGEVAGWVDDVGECVTGWEPVDTGRSDTTWFRSFAGAGADLVAFMALAERGKIAAEQTEFPLSRAPEALEALAARDILGRAVPVPTP